MRWFTLSIISFHLAASYAGAQARTSVWTTGDGQWSDASHWKFGVPDGLVRGWLRGKSAITFNDGTKAVGGLSVGTGRDETVSLRISGGALVVRRNFLVIGEEDRGDAEVTLERGALHCVGDTCIAAANCEPGRQCKGTLRILGGNFATRILTMGWGPASEARLEVIGTKAEAVHVLDYVTLGAYLDRPASMSTIAFTLDEHGVTPITIQNPRGGLNIVRTPPKNVCRLQIALSAVPPREDVTLIAAKTKTRGEFDDLPEGADVSAKHQGREFHWTLTYHGGASGCDVMLTKVRGHVDSDPVTHTIAVPPPPKLLWMDMPLREPLPTSFEPAFEGAEGFGAVSRGGRGGREIAVENLNDSGPGSLRAAIEAKGPRVIVFRVGGEVVLKSHLAVREPFVSILGQTAPGEGIALRDRGVSVMTHDVVLRHLRIRPGIESHGDDAIEFYDAERCIVDHCSFEWGDDETCSITGLSDAITIQHCLIAEGLNHAKHSMASIAGGERVTWHHNLIAHCATRNPRFADVTCSDFRNNVIYNWGHTAAYGEFERLNFVNNWYKPGPSTVQNLPRFHIGQTMVPPHSLFATGNVLEGRDDATRDNWLAIGFDRDAEAAKPFEAAAVKTQSAKEAHDSVLQNVGATLPKRDAVDARIIQSVRDGTGAIIETEKDVMGKWKRGRAADPSAAARCRNVVEELLGDRNQRVSCGACGSKRPTVQPQESPPPRVPSAMQQLHRREFLHRAALSAGACVSGNLMAQTAGERPPANADVTVINPRGRVPVGLIIDDSTCLVNLNRFAVPQFAHVQGRMSHHAQLPWREWPLEIPDAFVRKFGEWAQQTGVKGKYSIVPYPACVGRVDRMLPGWTQQELEASIDLVRTLMMPNWDIHPEMITHTRVIDLKTGHPYPEFSIKFMENWDWSIDRSADELSSYMAYALGILKNIGLSCEGITTPGGFGSKARPQLAQATLESVRAVFGAEVPHYFRDVIAEGSQCVAPLVQNASGLDGNDPRCVVHVIACTGDWTGGWDATEPAGVDKFITADGTAGRMVDVITRGEPAMMLAHWTGIYHNGKELGFQIMQEVVKRLHARFDHLHWMKLADLSRYWAARELTTITRAGGVISFKAPFACSEFTVRWKGAVTKAPTHRAGDTTVELKEAARVLDLKPGTWCRDGDHTVACFALPKGKSELKM